MKGASILNESQENYTDLDDMIFDGEESGPSER